MSATGIYAIENLYTHRVYVGATKAGFRQRWRTHCSWLRGGYHMNNQVTADLEIYGACSFRMMVLQELPRCMDMAPFEQFWMDYLRARGVECYNQYPAYETVIPPVGHLDAETLRRYPYRLKDMTGRFHLSFGLFYRLIKSGEIRAVRDYGGWHVLREDYERFPEIWQKRRQRMRRTHAE
jgi:hypothetical protein